MKNQIITAILSLIVLGLAVPAALLTQSTGSVKQNSNLVRQTYCNFFHRADESCYIDGYQNLPMIPVGSALTDQQTSANFLAVTTNTPPDQVVGLSAAIYGAMLADYQGLSQTGFGSYVQSTLATIANDTGALLSNGVNGINGLAGSVGLNGLNGVSGLAGALGITGANGLAGAVGLNGINGLAGYIGQNGLNGLMGLIGQAGLAGLNGLNGLIGQSGLAGLAGLMGQNGINGLLGQSGLAGLNGVAGLNGLAGTNGVDALANLPQSGGVGQILIGNGSGFQLGSVVGSPVITVNSSASSINIDCPTCVTNTNVGSINVGNGIVASGTTAGQLIAGDVTFSVDTNVPTSVVNDTNIQGAIAGNALTLTWAGTLAANRLNSNVVQQVTNDQNVTGSISNQNLTLNWTGLLPINRGGTNNATPPNIGGVIYGGSGSNYASTSTGVQGQFLMSNGTSAPTWAVGALPLAGNTNNNTIRWDTASGTWIESGAITNDDTNNIINIGATTGPSAVTYINSPLNQLTGANSVIDMSGAGVLGINTVTNMPITTGTGLLTVGGNILQTGATTITSGTGAITLNGPTSVTGTNPFTVGTGVTTLNGNLFANGNTTIGNAVTDQLTINAIIMGATPLVFDGATPGGSTISFAITNPTANRTITFPNSTGTVCLTNSCASSASNGVTLTAGNVMLGGPLTSSTTVNLNGNNFLDLRDAGSGTGLMINAVNGKSGVNINPTAYSFPGSLTIQQMSGQNGLSLVGNNFVSPNSVMNIDQNTTGVIRHINFANGGTQLGNITCNTATSNCTFSGNISGNAATATSIAAGNTTINGNLTVTGTVLVQGAGASTFIGNLNTFGITNTGNILTDDLHCAVGGGTLGNRCQGYDLNFSDRRLKENIVDGAESLDLLKQLEVKNFSYTFDTTHATQEGLIAQDVYKIFPQVVHVGSDAVDANGNLVDPWSINYGYLTPLIIKSVQDVNAKVDAMSVVLKDATGSAVLAMSTSAESSASASLNLLTANVVRDASGNVTSFTLDQNSFLDLTKTIEGLSAEIDLIKTNLASLSTDLSKLKSEFTTGAVNMSDLKQLNISGALIVAGETQFEGNVSFNKNTAGWAVIKAGTEVVHVAFTAPFRSTPIVSISNVGNHTLASIENLSTNGFDIRVEGNASSDLKYSWTAFLVADATTNESVVRSTPAPTTAPTATPVPSETPSATPEPTATPEASVEPTATPEASVEPTATPEASASPEESPAN